MSSVVANGVRLRYLREGAGDPVLLLHGFLFGADAWRPQMDWLRDKLPARCHDLRSARSTREPQPYTDLGSDSFVKRQQSDAYRNPLVHQLEPMGYEVKSDSAA